jgi:hypothetical protein
MNQFVNYQWKTPGRLIKETIRENMNMNQNVPGKGLREFYKKLRQKGTDRRLQKSIGIK